MIARAHFSHLGPYACVYQAQDVFRTMKFAMTSLLAHKKEPLMTHKILQTPWSKVGQDLFTLGDENFLVTVDYYRCIYAHCVLFVGILATQCVTHLGGFFAIFCLSYYLNTLITYSSSL